MTVTLELALAVRWGNCCVRGRINERAGSGRADITCVVLKDSPLDVRTCNGRQRA